MHNMKVVSFYIQGLSGDHRLGNSHAVVLRKLI